MPDPLSRDRMLPGAPVPPGSGRPWPVPRRPWVLPMVWHDLLFAHWPVPASPLRDRLPAGLELDLHEGQAWLGVVPFRMTGIRPRGFPHVPGLSSFIELNLRTYVTAGGRPGVWFLSLDASNPVAVQLARWSFRLPYFRAAMSCRADGAAIEYRSRRTHSGVPPAEFAGRYQPSGAPFTALPGSFEAWLIERYCLYTTGPQGRIRRGEIDHAPWQLQRAEAEFRINDMTRLAGLDLPSQPPHLLFSRQLAVRAWWLEDVAPQVAPA
jgi:uncharacterized protein YqjF (DUF2071 family)